MYLNNKKIKIAILGDGGWGTTLAILLSKKGHSVSLWGAFSDNILKIKQLRENHKFLPGIKIPKSIILTDKISHAILNKDLIVLATPSEHIRRILRAIKKDIAFNRTKPV